MKASDDKKKQISAKKKPIRLLIADDHSAVREGLVSLVKRKSDIVVVPNVSGCASARPGIDSSTVVDVVWQFLVRRQRRVISGCDRRIGQSRLKRNCL